MYVAGGLLCVGKEKNGEFHFIKALSPHLKPIIQWTVPIFSFKVQVLF